MALIVGALALLTPAFALARAGDVYVADLGGGGDGTLWKVGPGGGDATLVATEPGFSPAGLALLPSGNLLAADYGPGERVWEINPRTGAISTFLDSPPLSEPQDVIVAADGSILISDRGGGPGGTPAVFRVNPKTKDLDTVASGTPPFDSTVRGLAAKRDGTIFAAGLDSIYRISPERGRLDLCPLR